jgi:hypothetical protein
MSFDIFQPVTTQVARDDQDQRCRKRQCLSCVHAR